MRTELVNARLLHCDVEGDIWHAAASLTLLVRDSYGEQEEEVEVQVAGRGTFDADGYPTGTALEGEDCFDAVDAAGELAELVGAHLAQDNASTLAA